MGDIISESNALSTQEDNKLDPLATVNVTGVPSDMFNLELHHHHHHGQAQEKLGHQIVQTSVTSTSDNVASVEMGIVSREKETTHDSGSEEEKYEELDAGALTPGAEMSAENDIRTGSKKEQEYHVLENEVVTPRSPGNGTFEDVGGSGHGFLETKEQDLGHVEAAGLESDDAGKYAE